MRTAALTLAALAAIGFLAGITAEEARAGTVNAHVGLTLATGHGYGGHHAYYGHHPHRRYHYYGGPRFYHRPPVVVPFPGHPPVVHPPLCRPYRYHHYPERRFYFRGPRFGLSFGW